MEFGEKNETEKKKMYGNNGIIKLCFVDVLSG